MIEKKEYITDEDTDLLNYDPLEELKNILLSHHERILLESGGIDSIVVFEKNYMFKLFKDGMNIRRTE